MSNNKEIALIKTSSKYQSIIYVLNKSRANYLYEKAKNLLNEGIIKKMIPYPLFPKSDKPNFKEEKRDHWLYQAIKKLDSSSNYCTVYTL